MTTEELAVYAATLVTNRDKGNAAMHVTKKALDDCLFIKFNKSKELSDAEKESAELEKKIEKWTKEKKAADAKVEEKKASLVDIAAYTSDAKINYDRAYSATKTAEDDISKLLRILSPRKTFRCFLTELTSFVLFSRRHSGLPGLKLVLGRLARRHRLVRRFRRHRLVRRHRRHRRHQRRNCLDV